MGNRNISPVTKVIVYIVMIFFTVLTIYPIIWLVLQSFKTNTDYLTHNKLALPTSIYFGNYSFVMKQGNFFMFFKNSVIYSVVTVIAVVIMSNMAGFAFAKLKYKITKFLHGLFIIGILLTLQSMLIPLFLMVNAAGIHNTRTAVLIPYIALGLPMGVYLCTDFEKSIPDELIEAARIDGASYLHIFRRVILPICSPVSVTLAIITFTGTWNEFVLMSLMTSSESYKAIPYMVGRYAGALGSDYGKLFTSLTVALIPILIFYFVFRNHITKGVAAGAVKG
ncbi:MAG: carbohydrate ABC transporter permease [Christensenellales bacterium]|jgi:raffinose/stachyose/melibiose transport system permease protein